MTTGMEIRAQIDAEITRALILINGGAAVALSALLPYVISHDNLHSLARAILLALLMYVFALFFAVVSSRFRRICSLEYERAGATSPAGHPSPCKPLLGYKFKEPCVCVLGTAFMWLSVILFVVAGGTVFSGGMISLY